jgi:hypothetical protein
MYDDIEKAIIDFNNLKMSFDRAVLTNVTNMDNAHYSKLSDTLKIEYYYANEFKKLLCNPGRNNNKAVNNLSSFMDKLFDQRIHNQDLRKLDYSLIMKLFRHYYLEDFKENCEDIDYLQKCMDIASGYL